MKLRTLKTRPGMPPRRSVSVSVDVEVCRTMRVVARTQSSIS